MVVGVDQNPRAIGYARLNQAMNCAANVRFLEGDLFEPVQGRRFDLIMAHPPYVPCSAPGLVLRDGGPDGEQVWAGLLRGIPQHLADPGEFRAYAMLSDRKDGSAEERIRARLGSVEADFDVFLLVESERSARNYICETRKGSAAMVAFAEHCLDLGIVRLIVASVAIRFRGGRKGVTVRRFAFDGCALDRLVSVEGPA